MTPDLATNVLYYGDNLDILRRYLPDAQEGVSTECVSTTSWALNDR